MDMESKRRTAEKLQKFRMPRYAELPNMGLYLEQTTKYINTCLEPLGCLEITPSMVSNYVKKGLLPNPVKKQYYAEHIAYLFFVAIAKNMLSMEDIGLFIKMQQHSYDATTAYNYLCAEMENIIFYIFGLKDTLEQLGDTQSLEKDLLCSLVFSAANVIYMHACMEGFRNEVQTRK